MRDHPAITTTHREAHRGQAVAEPAGALCVLCIAGDRPQLQRLCEAAKAAGGTVVGAVDGTEAVARARERAYHAVLLDLDAPAIDAYEVITDLAALEETRGAAMVALVEDEAETDRLALSLCCDVLRKPVAADALRELLERLGDRSEAASAPQVRRLERQLALLRAELTQAQAEAEAVRQQRLLFGRLEALARELGQPMTMILCYAQMLPADLDDPTAAQLDCSVIVQQMEHLARLLGQIQRLLPTRS